MKNNGYLYTFSFPVAAPGKWDIGIYGYRKSFQKTSNQPTAKIPSAENRK